MEINYEAEQAIPVEKLREIFLYDHTTGILLHRTPKGRGGARVFAGQPAGGDNGRGYLKTRIEGRKFFNHRIIFAMVYGHWPEIDLDHIDQNKMNNRIENLRLATRPENVRNTGLRVDNESGVRGVSWYRRRAKWAAFIKFGDRKKHLGYFNSLADAALVRRVAEACLWGGLHAFPQEAETGINCAN